MKHMLLILAVAALGFAGCDTAPEADDVETTPAPATTDNAGTAATPAP